MVTESMERLLALIPYGKANAISREQLSSLMDVTDRKVRKMIEELRMEGHIICSSTQQKGYWKPTKRSEVIEFIIQMNNYGKKCFRASKSAREYMKNHEDQLHV